MWHFIFNAHFIQSSCQYPVTAKANISSSTHLKKDKKKKKSYEQLFGILLTLKKETKLNWMAAYRREGEVKGCVHYASK